VSLGTLSKRRFAADHAHWWILLSKSFLVDTGSCVYSPRVTHEQNPLSIFCSEIRLSAPRLLLFYVNVNAVFSWFFALQRSCILNCHRSTDVRLFSNKLNQHVSKFFSRFRFKFKWNSIIFWIYKKNEDIDYFSLYLFTYKFYTEDIDYFCLYLFTYKFYTEKLLYMALLFW